MRRNQKCKLDSMLNDFIEPSQNKQNFELFTRILYVLLVSHIGYLGIAIEIVWNYLPMFFVILRLYWLYSNFVCISSILNMRFEQIYAALIIIFGCVVSNLAVTLFV